MNKKILKWLTALVVAMLLIVGVGPTLAHATGSGADHKTDVIITKVETSAGLTEMDHKELAKGIDDLEAHFGQAAVPLSGVHFTYYSVTEDQLATLKANPNNFDTPAKMTAAGYGNGMEVGPTDSAGQVTLPQLANGHYWIVENDRGTIASSAAVPFALTLPFTNLNGKGWLDKIYVYPKNVLEGVPAQEDLIKKIVTVDGLVDHKDFKYGDVVTWDLTIDIPKGIEDYASFIVKDPDVTGLDYIGNVTVSDNLAPAISHDNGELVVNFNEILAELEELESITIRFDVKFTKDIAPDVLIINKAYLDFDNGHGDTGTIYDTATVITGGAQFVKKGESHKVLEGAVFIIRNDAGQYYNYKDGVVSFGAEADATEITSKADGTFEVKGLTNGKYMLKEVKAPIGYALPTNQDVTEFIVKAEAGHGSYTKDLNIIRNVKITIPQTGGMGTAAFTVIGGLLMVFAVAYYRKTSEA